MKRTGFALRRADPTARASVPVFKPKRCKVCKESFRPTRSIQPVCAAMACNVGYAEALLAKKKATAAKADRKETKAKLEKLKTRSDYIKEAQREFNRYIRLRDAKRLCICCAMPLGLFSVGGAYDCGHYRSVGSAPHLRFDERNAHAQRKQCNRYGAGRAVDYRIGLVARIGLEAVVQLEADQAPKHYSIEDLKAIKAEFRAKTRALQTAAEDQP